jgi:hypothetical protein
VNGLVGAASDDPELVNGEAGAAGELVNGEEAGALPAEENGLVVAAGAPPVAGLKGEDGALDGEAVGRAPSASMTKPLAEALLVFTKPPFSFGLT